MIILEMRHHYFYVVLIFFHFALHAEKVLVYDPVKGIILIDKDSAPLKAPPPVSKSTNLTEKNSTVQRNRNDLHIGRPKDPPELYFKSGLEYYKNNDFKNSLKNFLYADSVDHKPEYMLWIGRTLRQLKDFNKMLFTLHQITQSFPESDIADDALFEIALYYQNNNNYELAKELYTKLIEQYPFGLSYTTGEELREVAREQKKLMRAEMLNLLSILGFNNDELSTRYKMFQRSHNIQQTGTADQITVNAIKQAHKDFLAKEESNALRQKNSKTFTLLTIIAGCISVFNILFLFFLKSKISSKHKHIGELSKILKDLELSKL